MCHRFESFKFAIFSIKTHKKLTPINGRQKLKEHAEVEGKKRKIGKLAVA